jgi:hypothetical protein
LADGPSDDFLFAEQEVKGQHEAVSKHSLPPQLSLLLLLVMTCDPELMLREVVGL